MVALALTDDDSSWYQFAGSISGSTGRPLATRRVVAAASRALVGQTPKSEVWRKNKACLYRYRRATPPTRRTPLLLLPSLINQAYILDLCPGVSFAEFLLGEGFDVFLFDWGPWGPEDRNVSVSDLVTRYLTRAVNQTHHAAGHDLTLLGHCIGGTLWTCFSALYPTAPVQNLVLFTTPIDFEEAGAFGVWTAKGCFPIDRIRELMPTVPGQLIDYGHKMLNPIGNWVGTYVRLWADLGDPAFNALEWQAMHRWWSESAPFPAAAFHQWITEFYQQNRLVGGALEMNGRAVRLSAIDRPILNIVAQGDSIATRPMTGAIFHHVSSADKEELLPEGDHVDAVVSSAAKRNLWPLIVDWLARHD